MKLVACQHPTGAMPLHGDHAVLWGAAAFQQQWIDQQLCQPVLASPISEY